MIKKLEHKMQQEASDRQKLDEERRRAETEIQRVQKTLESERALALDKEEIYKRLQIRESELAEKLAGALEDQEKLEEQLDELILAKKKAESESQSLSNELAHAGQIISKLEAEKKDLFGRISELDERLLEVEDVRSRKTQLEEDLRQEINLLKSHLSMKERKIQEFEQKSLKSQQDIDIRLASTTKELQASKRQAKDLSEENRQIKTS